MTNQGSENAQASSIGHTAENDALVSLLARVDAENAINCTGLGEVGCYGREGWHSWSEHRRHVAEAQIAALAEAGCVFPPGE